MASLSKAVKPSQSVGVNSNVGGGMPGAEFGIYSILASPQREVANLVVMLGNRPEGVCLLGGHTVSENWQGQFKDLAS